MKQLLRIALVATLVASFTGCCASPYRRWQNYIGWNNPRPEHYLQGPPPPVTTPPGPVSPAVIKPGEQNKL